MSTIMKIWKYTDDTCTGFPCFIVKDVMLQNWHKPSDPPFKSAEFLIVLNVQVIPSLDIFFPGVSGIFQDHNVKIHRAVVVK